MPAALKRIDGLGGHGSGFFRASVKSALWLPLRLPIRYQKGLNPPLLATRIRRKYLALSAGYELLSKLQNLYVPVRSRPAPPIRSQQLIPDRGRNSLAALWLVFTAVSILLLTESLMPSGVFLKKTRPCTIFRCQRVNRNRSSCRVSCRAGCLLYYHFCRQIILSGYATEARIFPVTRSAVAATRRCYLIRRLFWPRLRFRSSRRPRTCDHLCCASPREQRLLPCLRRSAKHFS